MSSARNDRFRGSRRFRISGTCARAAIGAIGLFGLVLASPGASLAQAPAPAPAGAPAAAAPAPAPAATVWTVGAGSSVTYHLVHKLHKVDGVSKQVSGKARILPSGQAQVAISVPTESFDSANVNRDAHMKETVEAARYPQVEIKAIGEGIQVPATFPATIEKTWKAQVGFHGVQQPLDVPVKLVFESATRATATAALTVSLDQFKVERPSMMLVKVDDALKIDATVVFTK